MVENEVKTAIYVRVSTEEQAREGISLSAQIERCKAFCVARGWQLSQIYRDAGFSAGTIKRPAFQQLLADAKEKRFNNILVYKIDRFSRQLKDLITVLEELKKQEINFTSVTEQIDTTTAMGEAFFQIIGVFAQLERGMVKERVELAFSKKINAGEVLNRAPLGYLFKNSQLLINEKEEKKIKELFELWVQGISYKEIIKKFNLPKSTFYTIIKNPVYTGYLTYKKKLCKATHQPIISEELFKEAQKRLKKK